MTDLIYTEKELVQSLREYIKAEESKLAAVKRYIYTPFISILCTLYHNISEGNILDYSSLTTIHCSQLYR